jgi:hypothetical protein
MRLNDGRPSVVPLMFIPGDRFLHGTYGLFGRDATSTPLIWTPPAHLGAPPNRSLPSALIPSTSDSAMPSVPVVPAQVDVVVQFNSDMIQPWTDDPDPSLPPAFNRVFRTRCPVSDLRRNQLPYTRCWQLIRQVLDTRSPGDEELWVDMIGRCPLRR